VIPRFLTSFIPSPVRARGEDYVRGRRVRFARATSDEIAALVQGTDGYLVRLSAAPGKLSLSCTCPYAADHLVCKHQWAVLRRADAEGKLRRLLNLAGPRPELSAKPGDTDPEDGEPYDDTDEEDLLALDEPWLANNGIIPVARAPLPPRAAAKPAAPEWKRQLESVLQGLRYPGAPRPAPPGVWPDRRRLVYVVDIPASAHTGGLMVELAVETAQRDGTWGAPVQFRLDRKSGLPRPTPPIRELPRCFWALRSFAPTKSVQP
jgi:hypothetical protein